MSVDEILLRSRFTPLRNILCYDVFDRGFNGWMTLMPNFTEHPTLMCLRLWLTRPNGHR